MLTLKRLGKILKKNYRFIIGIVIGILLTGTSVYAANTIYSKNVTYDNSNSGLSSVNVQDALDELYLKMYPSQFYKKLYESAVRDDKSSTYVSNSDGIDFSEISSDTNGKGLYIASGYTDYKYPILYYRGDVNNNNLIFAGFCWKIVRTTETGGIKLIYNGTPNNGVCNATGEDTQIGTSAFNTNYNSPAYVGYMYGTVYSATSKNMGSVTNTYYYGKDVTYSNGTYTLKDTISSSNWSSIYNGGLNNNHYTCMGGTTCSSVYYIYRTDSSYMYYITLTGGKKVEDALNDMLNNNTTSSTIKNTLDNWYNTNIKQKGYSDYIDNIVWFNDRNISDLGGWDPNGGQTRAYYLAFEPNYRSTKFQFSLIFNNDIDRFSVEQENGNGNLSYSIGLLSTDEIMLAGGKVNTSNNNYYLYSGTDFWTLSPFSFSNYYGVGAIVFSVRNTGQLTADWVYYDDYGVRPSIALVPDVEISSGTGTENNPYIVG